jgi:hypothetical protein
MDVAQTTLGERPFGPLASKFDEVRTSQQQRRQFVPGARTRLWTMERTRFNRHLTASNCFLARDCVNSVRQCSRCKSRLISKAPIEFHRRQRSERSWDRESTGRLLVSQFIIQSADPRTLCFLRFLLWTVEWSRGCVHVDSNSHKLSPRISRITRIPGHGLSPSPLPHFHSIKHQRDLPHECGVPGAAGWAFVWRERHT